MGCCSACDKLKLILSIFYWNYMSMFCNPPDCTFVRFPTGFHQTCTPLNCTPLDSSWLHLCLHFAPLNFIEFTASVSRDFRPLFFIFKPPQLGFQIVFNYERKCGSKISRHTPFNPICIGLSWTEPWASSEWELSRNWSEEVWGGYSSKIK